MNIAEMQQWQAIWQEKQEKVVAMRQRSSLGTWADENFEVVQPQIGQLEIIETQVEK